MSNSYPSTFIVVRSHLSQVAAPRCRVLASFSAVLLCAWLLGACGARTLKTEREAPAQHSLAETTPVQSDFLASGADAPVTPPAPPVPSITMPSGFQVLAPGKALPLRLNYVRFARLRTLALDSNEINEASRHLGTFQPNDDPLDSLPKAWRKRANQHIINVGVPREGAVENFDPFAGNEANLVLVIFDAPEQSARVALVQRGAINVLMKTAQNQGLVWVTDASGEPVKGATVQIVQGKSQRHSTQTNAEGLAVLPAQDKLSLKYKQEQDGDADYYQPLLAIASKGKHLAFTSQRWTTGVEPWEFDIPMAYYYGSGALVGTVTPERGIYRPGHPIHIVGAIRKREKDGRLSVPQGKALVRVLDPDYNSVLSTQATVTEFGTFRFSDELPITARLGRYSIEATVGDTTLYSEFRVAKYRPARFEVKVSEVEPVVLNGNGSIVLEAQANYLYGAKVAEGKVNYDVSLRPAGQEPNAEGFSASAFDTMDPVPVLNEEHELKDGVHRLTIPTDTLTDAGFPESQLLELLIQATVTDKAGDSITGHQVIQLHKNPQTVWLKNRNWLVDTTAGWDFEVKTTQLAASENNEAITVELYRREWVSTAYQNAGGVSYSGQQETKLIESRKVPASSSPQSLHFKLKSGGTYLARAFKTGSNAYAETSVWAYGDDSYGSFDNQPRLGLHSDKESYEPGDTARLLVESPYKKALALVTLEQGGVLYSHVQRLSGAGTEIKVAINNQHLPNVYAGVAVIPQTDAAFNVAGSPLRVGYVHLKVSPETRRLKVELLPRKKEASPGETVPVDILLKDHRGKPVQGEVTLWASDEGVLKLTGYQTPDVFSPIFRAHYLGVSTSASLLRFTELGYEDDGTGGDSAPGGDTTAAFRSRFLETAFFSEGVRTDRLGKATVLLPLPDNITRWRVMATAADKADRFGSSETNVIARKRLQIEPSLPRFLSVGDQLQAAVVIHNDQAAGGTATVTFSASGTDLLSADQQQVQVPASSQTTVVFPLRVRREGSAEIRASVELGGEKDGFLLTLPVHSPVERHTSKVLDQVVSGSQSLAISLPQGANPETAKLIVESAPGEIASLGAALDSLMDYPHGCTEQTTSRLIPMAQLGGVLGGHPVFESATHKSKMQDAVLHLLGHQHPEGGFGLWPESEPEGFLTAYALWGLQLAQENGVEVPASSIENAYGYLARTGGNVDGYGYIGEGDRRPFAAFIFAKRSRALPQDFGDVFQEASSLSGLGQGLLVASEPKSARSAALLQSMLLPPSNAAKQAAQDRWVTGNVELQDRAGLILGLLAKQRTSEAEPHAKILLNGRGSDGSWGTTYDNLWALVALNQYFRKALSGSDTTLQVTLADTKVAERPGAQALSHSLVSTRAKPYARETLALPAVNLNASFKQQGTHAGRVIARLSYEQDVSTQTPVSAGFKVTRQIFDYATGKPVDRAKVGQLLRVEVTLEADIDRHQVALVDRLPAGLEPVDLALTTSPGTANNSQEDYDYTWVYREAHDERVSFFSDSLSAGTHSVTYIARATRQGTFVQPAPRAEAMYQVDVFGLGALGTFIVE